MSLPIENRTQLRVLKMLVDFPTGTTLRQLQLGASTTYKALTKNLEQLKQKGFIIEHRYGKRIRIIKLNTENPKTHLIIKLFTEEEKNE